MEEYEQALAFSVTRPIAEDQSIGQLGQAVKTGLVMASTTVLEVRFTQESGSLRSQDCLENTFSCLRQRNYVPPPVEFHYALRVTVGQFLLTTQWQLPGRCIRPLGRLPGHPEQQLQCL